MRRTVAVATVLFAVLAMTVPALAQEPPDNESWKTKQIRAFDWQPWPTVYPYVQVWHDGYPGNERTWLSLRKADGCLFSGYAYDKNGNMFQVGGGASNGRASLNSGDFSAYWWSTCLAPVAVEIDCTADGSWDRTGVTNSRWTDSRYANQSGRQHYNWQQSGAACTVSLDGEVFMTTGSAPYYSWLYWSNDNRER